MNFLKPFLFVFILLACNCVFGQDSKEDKRILDSLIANDEFLQLLNSLDADKSYFTISVGASNRLASVNNNSINAQQGNLKTVITPAVSYNHKSGLGLSAAGYVVRNAENNGLHRFSLTPFYNHSFNKSLALGLSYTRFFSDNKYNAVESPIQNDLYANVLYKKGFVEPGLAFGYSTGKYNEIDKVTINIPREGRTTFSDTAITSIKSFSVTGSVEHRFLLYTKMSKQSALLFIPSILLNAGNNSFSVTHHNNFPGTVRGNGRRRLFRTQDVDGVSAFELQSTGLNLYLNYSIHKFSFQPQIYLDYYLPSTSESRFTQLFNVNIEYSF
ncbi:MAG: hypothetical protein ABIR81_04440 [Ginsengibacter sp.]